MHVVKHQTTIVKTKDLYIQRHREKDGFQWFSFKISDSVELVNFSVVALIEDLKNVYGINPCINLS